MALGEAQIAPETSQRAPLEKSERTAEGGNHTHFVDLLPWGGIIQHKAHANPGSTKCADCRTCLLGTCGSLDRTRFRPKASGKAFQRLVEIRNPFVGQMTWFPW